MPFKCHNSDPKISSEKLEMIDKWSKNFQWKVGNGW